MKVVFWAIFLFLSVVGIAVAFESDEHALISSNGLQISQTYYFESELAPCKHSSAYCDDIRDTFQFFLKTRKAKKIKIRSTFYGLLSVYGDYQFDPYDYFKVWRNFSGLPNNENAESFNHEYIKLLDEFDGSYRLFHASHNNSDHFQEQLMFSFWWWHKVAVEQASDGNLFSALLFNSFADHFLEDFFAPGHIQTPRENMNDAYATAVHDFYNKRGSKYNITEGKTLLALLSSVEPGKVGTINNIAFSNDEIQRMQQKLSTNGQLYLYGDHSFKHKETNMQQLFMSLVIARSISDVFDTYIEHRNENTNIIHNSFDYFNWTSRTAEQKKLRFKIEPAKASINFGFYEPVRHIVPVYSTVFDLGVSHISTFGKENGEEQTATEIDLLFSVFGAYFHSMGNNSRKKNGNVNKRWRHYLFPFGGSIPMGFTFLTDDYTNVYKLKVEPMWHFARYSAFVGVPITYGKYENRNSDISENQAGVGLEIGMGFGMVHFVGGVAIDSLYTRQGSLDRMLMVKAGIRVIFPGSRLPWAKKISQ